jgi:hypothetical protein
LLPCWEVAAGKDGSQEARRSLQSSLAFGSLRAPACGGEDAAQEARRSWRSSLGFASLRAPACGGRLPRTPE